MSHRHVAHPRFAHLNGAIVPAESAKVSPFDRGFLFGDGVYEGLRAFAGRIVGLKAHTQRMRAGLRAARIAGFDPEALGPLSIALLEAEGIEDAFIYWQITRGAPGLSEPARSRELAALAALTPTALGFATPQPALEAHTTPATKTATLRPDTRWLRGAVKSISLLGGALAGIEAQEAGADDAMLVRDGLVAETPSANVFLAKGGAVATPSLESAPILAGVTRGLLCKADPSIESRPIRVEELWAADEIMLVGTTTMVASVTRLDGKAVGGGPRDEPGPVARRLLRTLVEAIRADIGLSAPQTSSRAAIH